MIRSASSSGRFDIALVDLIWDDYRLEFSFDGLDVLNIVRRWDPQLNVIFAVQGHCAERDHIDEAMDRPHVAGVWSKASGSALLVEAARIAVARGKLLEPDFPSGASPSDIPRIHRYFERRRQGKTAAKMAGAIASWQAVDHTTLAAAAGIERNTATRVVGALGPLIRSRDELPADLQMTTAAVYRWCGEHARYILSWCRRNELDHIARRVTG